MQRDIPKGTIFAWSGSVADIPITFHLCDGARGTPDLRSRFIRGANGAIAPGATGGSASKNHTFTDDGHAHIVELGILESLGTGVHHTTVVDNAHGTTDNTNDQPSWYALSYIMYLAVKR